jgi:2-methylcitrate dehydratase
VEDAEWTRRYHTHDPHQKAFGGWVEIIMKNGDKIADEMAVANAHSLGASPWVRPDYIRKLETLTEGVITAEERRRFLEVIQRITDLEANDFPQLNVQLDPATLKHGKRDNRGIF